MRQVHVEEAARGAAADPRSPLPGTQMLDPIPFHVVYSDAITGLGTTTTRVVRAEGEWAVLWPEIAWGHVPPIALPRVDFARDMLLVVALGSRGSSGYGVEIERVARRDGALHVRVIAHESHPEASAAAVMTSPAVVASVPRHDGPVEFVWRTEVGPLR